MRVLLAVLALLPTAAPANAADIERVSIEGDPVVGGVLDVVVEVRDASRVRVTFPDLQGWVAQRSCCPGASRVRRFVLPYRPGWAGRHVLVVSAAGRGRDWRPLVVDVPHGRVEAEPAFEGSVTALIGAARRHRGLPPLRPLGARRAATRYVTSVSGPPVPPARLVTSWLAGDALGALLDPAVTRIDVRVIEHRRRPGATYVIRLAWN
jgi:hypothetical protein